MNTNSKPTGAQPFVTFEIALEVIVSLRNVVAKVRRHSGKLATQIEDSASSAAANTEEGSRRIGKDRLHLYRVAAGSAAETRAHLRVAMAWGWIEATDAKDSFSLLDRQLALLWRLTH